MRARQGARCIVHVIVAAFISDCSIRLKSLRRTASYDINAATDQVRQPGHDPVLLILSARTVTEEIALQFGRLPPSFLPLGSKRLFEYQRELALGEPCVMTVPEDFEIPATDKRALAAAGIELLYQPQRLRLTEAIGDALARLDPKGPLRVLYGDTLVEIGGDTLVEPDIITVHETTANYAWAFIESNMEGGLDFSDEVPQRLDKRRVVCGYYTFSDTDLLARACRKDTIVKALRYYNDERPLTCRDAASWLDFGHLPLYFRSKKDLLVKRVFNELNYEDHLLIKSSPDTAKMRAEAHWFEELPGSLQLHVPRYRGRVERDFRAGYALEYLYAPLLSDLAVFGALPLASWLEIMQACFEFIGKCQTVRPPSGAPEASPEFSGHFFDDLIVKKTRTRLEAYGEQSGITLNSEITLNGFKHPPLGTVVDEMIAMIPPTRPDHIRFWHGDLFFGNMFYDFTAQRVLCIDPRGQLGSGQLCLWGDLRYDLAKLAHSIVGQYDKVLLGRSTLVVSPDDPLSWQFDVEALANYETLEEILFAHARETCGVENGELLALTSLLFLSMLPLHHDHPERQKHLLATGLKLSVQAKEAG